MTAARGHFSAQARHPSLCKESSRAAGTCRLEERRDGSGGPGCDGAGLTAVKSDPSLQRGFTEGERCVTRVLAFCDREH